MLERLSLLLYGAAACLTLLLLVGGDALPWGRLALLTLGVLGAATLLRAQHGLRTGRAWWWGRARREEEPGRFWAAVGLTYLIGAGCLGSAVILALGSA